MRQLRNIFCILFFASALLACSSPKLSQLNEGDVILAFGDSLTVGVGVNPEHSYPSVLASLSGFEVVSSGVSGETTAGGLQRLPDVIEKHSPRLVILLEGGNDILRNRSPSEIKNNLEKMIQLALEKGIEVVLIGVPEKSLFSNSAPFYTELAEKYDLVFASSLIGSLMRSPSKKSDAIHFNKDGYAELAEGIYELLIENGAFE
jgi:acyl-CoA thioesterase-1